MSVGGLIGGAIVTVVAVAAFSGGANPDTPPVPGPTVPSSAAMTVPPTVAPNPGYGLHCTYGPRDNDVRSVVTGVSAPTLPNC